MSRHPHLPKFDGGTYEAPLDGERLLGQQCKVEAAMSDRQWHTLRDLCCLTGYESTASVSARIRDMRKARRGGQTVEKRRKPGTDPRSGVWEYRLVPAQPAVTVEEGGQLALEVAA